MTRAGGKRYRVVYRVGGRESATRYGGSFKTKPRRSHGSAGSTASSPRAASPSSARSSEPAPAPTFARSRRSAGRSRASTSPRTRSSSTAPRSGRMLPLIGTRRVDTLTPADVAELVGELQQDAGSARRSARSLLALAMVLDHAGVAAATRRATR